MKTVKELIEKIESSLYVTNPMITRTGEDTWTLSTVGYCHMEHVEISNLFVKSGLFSYDFSRGGSQEFDKMSGRTFAYFKRRTKSKRKSRK